MAKTLRTLSDPDFSTKGNTLTWQELDQNFIDLHNQMTDGSFDLSVNTLDVTDAATTLTNLGLTATASELNRLDGSLAAVRTNLGLTDASATLDLSSLDIGGTEVIDSSRNASFVGGTFTGDVELNSGSFDGAVRKRSGLSNTNSVIGYTDDTATTYFAGFSMSDGFFSIVEGVSNLNTAPIRLYPDGKASFGVAGLSGSETLRVAGKTRIESANDALELVGGSTGNANSVFIEWLQSDNTRVGFIGDASGSNTDFYVNADISNLRIVTGSGSVLTNSPIQADNFSAGSIGWQISYAGAADFRSASIDTAQIQTLRTTLFKPTTINGMGGEIVFSAVSTVVSIDTGANTIVAEDAVFSNGDKVVVSSAIYNQSGFSTVELNITSAGSAVSGGTEYSYTVNSGDEADIDTGDTITRASGDLVYINANTGTGAPSIAGYDNVTGFADSPLSGGTATPVWELKPTEAVFAGGAATIDTSGLQFTSGGSGGASAQAIKWGGTSQYILGDGTNLITLEAQTAVQVTTEFRVVGANADFGGSIQVDSTDRIAADGGFIGSYHYTGVERTVSNPEAFNTGIVATNGGTLHVWASVGGIAGAVGVGPDGLAKVAYTTGTDIGADTTGDTSTPDTGDGDNGKINVVTNTNEVVYIVNKLNISSGDIYWLWMAESD